MWTPENRPRYNRDKLRYPSDLTDDEWACIETSIPPAKHGGRPREINLREVLNGIMYVLSTGTQWRYVPKDILPRSTLHDYFQRWQDDGTLGRIHHALYMECREQMGREASPTACVIDSQCVKSAEKGGRVDPHGYDAGKKIKGKKRHILVDTTGLLFWSIRQVCCCMRSFIRRIFRTVTAGSWSCRACLVCSHSYSDCSLTPGIRGRSSRPGRQRYGPTS